MLGNLASSYFHLLIFFYFFFWGGGGGGGGGALSLFFYILFFYQKKSSRNNISMSKFESRTLGPTKCPPVLGPKCFQRLSADHKKKSADKTITILSSKSCLSEPIPYQDHTLVTPTSSCDAPPVSCLFVLLLYVPSQQLWSWRDGQFTLPHFFLGKLEQAVTSTSCTYFACN